MIIMGTGHILWKPTYFIQLAGEVDKTIIFVMQKHFF